MRKWIIGIVFLFSAAFITTSLSEITRMAGGLHRANLDFLVLALGIQVIWFFILGRTFQSIYRMIGLQENLMRLTVVAIAANFINIVAPSAGAGGTALFIDDGKRRGHSTGKVTAAGAISLLLDYLAFLLVLTLGLIVLFRRNNLDTGEILASALILLITISLTLIIYLGSKSANLLSLFLSKIGANINRMFNFIFHRDLLDIEHINRFAAELATGLSAFSGELHRLLGVFLFALANKAALIMILWLTFLAFDVPFSGGTIIGGFAIGYLFTIVSPTPAGVGVMEGMFVLALNSLHVEWASAVVIALIYRAVTFWFALGVGALAFQYLAFEKRHSASTMRF